MKKQVNIFVISNPFSALMANMIAFSNEYKHYENYALIDHSIKNNELVKEIFSILNLSPWTIVKDFSIKTSDPSFNSPSASRKIIRKLRTKPIFKKIYNILQKKKMTRIDSSIYKLIKPSLSKVGDNSSINLFLLFQTYLNNSLIKIFSNAKINYYEHGLGDYILSAKEGIYGSKFYGLFALEFSKFNRDNRLIYNEVILKNNFKIERLEQKTILIILQNLEIYHIEQSFWFNYINAILKKEEKVNTFIIKPHPFQSEKTINLIISIFNKNEVKYQLMEKSICIEIEFKYHINSISSVYSPFSSSLFYLSKIYNHSYINYFESISTFTSYLDNAPLEYKTRILENKNLLKKVFAVNTKEFIFN